MPRRKVPRRRPAGHKKRRRSAWRSKRRGGSKATTTVMRGPSGFPDRIRVKLNYYALEQATLSAGVAAYLQYRGNSVYAPRYTSGHQPYAYDQWCSFYTKYRVLGSSIRVTPGWGGTDFTGSTSVNGIAVAVVPAPTDVAPGSEILEQPYSRYKTGYVAESNRLTVKHYMSTAKIFGVNRQAVHDEDNYAAAYNASPSDVWFWYVYVYNPFGTTDNMYMSFNVKLTYYVEFYRRYTMSQS